MKNLTQEHIWTLLRLAMGWIFFWPFLDKLFGFGFATEAGGGWLDGGSPTLGFLKFATKGPFAELYQGLAGNPVVDWFFMAALLAIGLAMLLGIGIRIAGYSGALLLLLMYTAGYIPPEHNPFLDNHFIYALIMIGLTVAPAGRWFGLGKWWENTSIVQRYQFLR